MGAGVTVPGAQETRKVIRNIIEMNALVFIIILGMNYGKL